MFATFSRLTILGLGLTISSPTICFPDDATIVLGALRNMPGIGVTPNDGTGNWSVSIRVPITPEIVDGLISLKKVTEINLWSDGIAPETIQLLASVKTLRTLKLQRSSKLDDKAFAHIARLSQIRAIEVEACPITDKALNAIEGLSLESVLLSNADAVDGPSELPKLLAQKRNISLSDQSLRSLGKIEGLSRIELRYTGVTGSGLKYLSPLRNLKRLTLVNAEFAPDSMTEAARFEQLEKLVLGGDRRAAPSDAQILSLCRLRKLKTLALSDIDISEAQRGELTRKLPDTCRFLEERSLGQ